METEIVEVKKYEPNGFEKHMQEGWNIFITYGKHPKLGRGVMFSFVQKGLTLEEVRSMCEMTFEWEAEYALKQGTFGAAVFTGGPPSKHTDGDDGDEASVYKRLEDLVKAQFLSESGLAG